MNAKEDNLLTRFKHQNSASKVALSHRIMKHLRDKENLENQEYYQAYLKIVEQTAILTTELKFTSPFLSGIFYEFLLWNGFLSQDKKIVYSKATINNVLVLGADVMLGKAACVNNAALLSDILNKLGIESYPFTCYILENRSSSNPFTDIIEKRFGNHAVTLFKDKDTWYIIDATTKVFLEFTSLMRAKVVDEDIYFIMKTFNTLMMSDITTRKLYEIAEFSTSNRGTLKFDDLLEMYKEVVAHTKDNMSLIEDFHQEITPEIDTVCRTLTKIHL